MLIHSGDKPHTVCETYGKSFTEKINLTKHMLSKKKPRSCEICGKSFTEIGKLTKHMLIYTGDKLHSCVVCGKSFTEKCNLSIC